MIEVSPDQMYREACLALGEAIVRERLLAQALGQAQQEPTE